MADRGPEHGLLAPARVPSSEDSPSFRNHLERTAPVAVAAATVHTLLLPIIFASVGWAVFGTGGFLPVGAMGLLVALSCLNWIPVIGNQTLRDNLVKSLGRKPGATFVGLRAVQGNGVQEALRVETDDNVGFLYTTDRSLEVVTEGGSLSVPRDRIRGFDTERMRGLPYLHYIRVEFEEDHMLKAFLVVSREGRSIKQHRKTTERLRARLVEWHAEHQLRWLEERGR